MKKVISCLAVLLLVALFSVTALASGTNGSVSSVSVYAGSEVSVPITLSSNAGFSYLKLSIQYDSTKLELLGIKNGTVATDAFVSSGNIASWDSSSDITGTGTLATLEFVANSEATGAVAVSVSASECYNYNEDNVAVSIAAGTVTINQTQSPTLHGGAVVGSVARDHTTHTWDAGVVTKEPTCTTTGIIVYTCTGCGDKNIVTIEATQHKYGAWNSISTTEHQRVCEYNETHVETAAHSWDAGVVTKVPTLVAAGVKTYTCTVCADTKTSTIARLQIVKQPESVEVGNYGDEAAISVSAKGTGLKYQWYFKDADDTSFKVSSTKKASYSFAVTEERDGRQVYCLISDSYGNSIKTNVATMSVAKAIRIVTQPKNAIVGRFEDTAFISVEAVGEELSYQWYFKNEGGSSFNASSVKTNTYSFPVTEERNGRQVYCLITDKYGRSVKSQTVTMQVTDSVLVEEYPVDVRVGKIGDTAEIKLKAIGDGLTYQWFFKDANSSKFTLSSTKTDSYSFPVTEERNGRTVYCVVSDKNGNAVITNTATMQVGDAVTLVEPLQDAVVAQEGDLASIIVNATGDGLYFKWYFKDANSTKFTVSSLTDDTYSFPLTAERNGREVYCVIYDAYGNSVKTNTVKMILATPVKITTQPVSVKVGKLDDTATITVKATGDGLVYRWYFKDAGSSSFTASTVKTDTYSFPVTTERNGRQVYCKITDQYGFSVKSNTVSMSVATPVKITTQPVSVKVAKLEDVATITLKATGDGLTYKWYFKDAGKSSFTASSSTTNTYSFPVTAERNGRQVYCVVTDKYGNTAKSNTVSMSVATPVKITTQPVSVKVAKLDDTATITLKATGDDLTYRWYFKDVGKTSFSASSVTTNTYSFPVTAERNGRQVYCIVTDKYGNTAKSNTVSMSVK